MSMPRAARLSEAEQATIAAMYAGESSYAEIGRRIGRDPSTAYRYLVRVGKHDPARPRPRRRLIPANRLDRALYLYQATNYPLPVIRRMTGVSNSTLYLEMSRRDIPHRRPCVSAAMRRVCRERATREARP